MRGFLVAAGLAAAGGLYWASYRPSPLLFDDASYYLLADSLANGDAYLTSWLPRPQRPRFPPGYPWALHWFIGSDIDRARAVPSLAASLAALPVIASAFAPYGAAAAAAYAAHPQAVGFSTSVMSEAPFILLSHLALLLALLAQKGPGFGKTDGPPGWGGERARPTVLWLAAVAAGVAAGYTRTIGWAVPAAVLGALALERRPRLTLVAAGLAAAAFAMFLSLTHTGEYVGLWSPVRQGAAFPVEFAHNAFVHFGRNVVDFATGSWTAAITRSGSPLVLVLAKTALSLAVSLLIAVGFFRAAGLRGWTALELYYVFYLGVSLAWGVYRYDYRFFLPLWPLSIYYLLGAAEAAWGSRGPRLAAGALAALALSNSAATLFKSETLTPYERDFLAVCDAVRKMPPADAVVYSPFPAGLYLCAGRRGTMPPADPAPGDLMLDGRPAILVVDRKFEDMASDFERIASGPPLFKTEGGRMAVYKIP